MSMTLLLALPLRLNSNSITYYKRARRPARPRGEKPHESDRPEEKPAGHRAGETCSCASNRNHRPTLPDEGLAIAFVSDVQAIYTISAPGLIDRPALALISGCERHSAWRNERRCKSCHSYSCAEILRPMLRLMTS